MKNEAIDYIYMVTVTKPVNAAYSQSFYYKKKDANRACRILNRNGGCFGVSYEVVQVVIR